MSSQHTNLPNNKHKTYGGAYSVHDTEIMHKRNDWICEFTTIDSSDMATAASITQTYLDTYKQWMWQGFNFLHHDLYQHACFTQGTTESFAHFYLRYQQGHRLRLFRAEYFYHQMMKSLWYKDKFAWLEDDDLRAGDVVLMSVPFSDTGDLPPRLDFLLDECERLEIPVMLDMAYLNIAVGQSFPHKIDLARDCIKYIVTSLSKVFPVENLRIGLRLQKEFYEDQIYVINETNYNYINLLSAFVGTRLMQNFSNNFVFDRYRQSQLEMCQQLNLHLSPCFTFGIDRDNQYPVYNRGGSTNRLCFSRVWDGRAQKQSLSN